jgi:zinc protease
MTRNPFRIALLFAALAVAVPLAPAVSRAADPAAEKAARPRKVVSIEGITEYELDNGLRVLLYPDPSAARVTVNMTVLVGSRHEGYGEGGMAHLLEHMLFKGTPSHPNVVKALQDHGAGFGTHANGTTTVDRTNYFETMPAGDDNLEFAIRLEADRLVNSYVKREDLASEMTVVRNEFEMGENSPGAVLGDRMMAAAYHWHNYGKPPIGNRSDIERVPIDRLQAFYRKHYQPDNVVLIVSGSFDEARALGHVARYFGALKRPARKLDATYTEEPPQDGERSATLRRVGKMGIVAAMYHIPAASHEDFAAVEVLANVLDPVPSGRLYKALVAPGKAASVSAVAIGRHDPGVLEISAGTASGEGLDQVRDTMTQTLESLASGGVEKEEVERARAMLLKWHADQLKDVNAAGVELSEWVARGDWRLYFLHRDRLEKVTADDVSRVAGKYLRRGNRTVGLFVPADKPDRTPVPAAPEVAGLVKDYKGREAVAVGEAFDATPANIEKRVRRSELPGGGKLVLLPKKSRGEAVTLQMALPYGNADSLRGQAIPAEFLAFVLNRGTRKHTYRELRDELDRNKITLSVGGGAGEVSVTVQCTRATLPKALELLREVLREPAFPQEEFDVLKRQVLAGLRQNLTEPSTLGPQALRRKLGSYPADDVRYVWPQEESIAAVGKLTLDEVRKVYEGQVGGAAAEVVVVGDFDAEATARAVGAVLDGWQSPTPYRRIGQPADTSVKGEKVVVRTPDKANAYYYAGLRMAIDNQHPDHAALVLGNYILGGGSASRLFNRVRAKDGLSYGVGSSYTAAARDRSASFTVAAIANPANMPKVEAAVAEELAKFLKDGVTDKEVEEAKKGFLEEMKNFLASDDGVATMLSSQLAAGRTLEWLADLQKKVGELTAAQVNEAFRKHVDPARLVIVEAGDFKTK